MVYKCQMFEAVNLTLHSHLHFYMNTYGQFQCGMVMNWSKNFIGICKK